MGNASSVRRLAWSALLLILGLLAPAPPAAAADRVALVVGIGRYQPLPALPNPPRDAEDMAAMLTRLGYEVDLVIDPDLPALRRATAGFARRLAAGRMGVFYYAGHGVQVGGRNFLVPRGARINGVEDLPVQGFSLDDALAAVQRTGKPTVVLLDACRDNPFRGLLREAAQPGLAEVNAGSGLLVGFATRPGGVAYDGKERNSPFTAALLRHLPDTRLEARQVLGRVREQVVRATGGRQVPWDQSSLISDLSLAGVMRFQGGLDAAAIPFVSQSVQQNLIRTYMANAHKPVAMLAIGRERGVACGHWEMPDRASGRRRTLQCCQHRNGGAPCFLYAEGLSPLPETLRSTPPVEDALPRQTGQAFDAAQVPFLSLEHARGELARYAAATGPKALAIHPGSLFFWRNRGMASNEEAGRAALEDCTQFALNRGMAAECVVYAEGDRVAYDPRRR